MKIVSLVPSWTETLINAGVNVIGRTRFCIHPNNKINRINAVGGTKAVNWSKLDNKPDLVIMDKEENTLEMAEACPYPVYATHIKSIYDVPTELMILADLINSSRLYEKAYQWQQLLLTPKTTHFEKLERQKILSWWRKPLVDPKKIVYLIWKDPYMSIGENTYIYSVFNFLGIKLHSFNSEDYPQLDLEKLSKQHSLLLFSSEPFPFHKQKQKMLDLGYSCAWVNGEAFSWYGDRSFDFLNKV